MPVLMLSQVLNIQKSLFYYGYAHNVKVTIKDCQRRDHLLFDAHRYDPRGILFVIYDS
jgi:hypothetical protein